MHRQKTALWKLLLLFHVCITGFVVKAGADEWSVYASSSGRFLVTRGFAGPLTLFVQPGEKFYGYLDAEGRFEYKNFGLQLRLSSWEISQETIDSGTLEDRATERGFVDEVFVFYGKESSPLHVKAGWQNIRLLDGYITDDYWPGLAIDFSFTLNGSVTLSPFAEFYKVEPDTFLTSSTSFYVGGGLKGKVKPAGFSFKIAFHTFFDRDDNLKNFLNETFYSFLVISKRAILRYLEEEFLRQGMSQTLAENYASMVYMNLLASEPFTQAEASIYWIWGNVGWEKGPWKLGLLAGGDLGSGKTTMLVLTRSGTQASVVPKEKTLNFSGYFFKPSFFWNGIFWLETELSLLWMSGHPEYVREVVSATADSTEIHAFFSFRPLIYDSAVFFQQGINTGLHTSNLVAAGIMGTGFVVPEFILRFYPTTRLYFELKNVFIMVEKKPKLSPSPFVGYELNLLGIWDITDYISLQTEFDFFLPGEFSPDAESGFMWTLGLDLHVDEKGPF